MKIAYSRRHLYILAFSLLFVVNSIVLWGVFTNRSTNPDFEGFLTERELGLPRRIQSENSGLSFHIQWRRNLNQLSGNYSPVWFSKQKLQELGFKIDPQIDTKEYRNYYNKQLPKEVYIVLEYNSTLYRKALVIAENELAKSEEKLQSNPEDKNLLQKYERIKNNFEQEKNTKSRLFAIDAGVDHAQLRGKYPDRSTYIITKGIVKPRFYSLKNKNRVVGNIRRLSTEEIHVPLKFKKELESFLNKNMTRDNDITHPRYKVKLAYGSRLEPYIVSLKQIISE